MVRFSVSGAGYFPDPHNCRRYWHCRSELVRLAATDCTLLQDG